MKLSPSLRDGVPMTNAEVIVRAVAAFVLGSCVMLLGGFVALGPWIHLLRSL